MLARRGLGQVAPNPAVGCILVREDLNERIVGRGWTQPGGTPHAEAEAILRAGEFSRGSTAYVTLEPCCHHGKTPPCTQALIKAGIKKAFVAVKDPDERVSGRGIRELKAAGIKIKYGLLRKEAIRVNQGFFSRITHQKPFITLKVASSTDGKIATKTGISKWITNNLSRKFGHILRAEHDAILTSINTVLKDDPSLDCRLPGMRSRSPIPIILDTYLRISPRHKIISKGRNPLIYSALEVPPQKKRNLEQLGARVFPTKFNRQNKIDLLSVASNLSQLGFTRILLECGGELSSSFLKAGLIDQIFWFRGPKIIGNDGISSIGNLNYKGLSQTENFVHVQNDNLGQDVLSIFEKKRESL